MTKYNFFGVLALFMLLFSFSAFAIDDNSYYFSGDFMTQFNSLPALNMSDYGNVYTGVNTDAFEYPTVCDALGSSISSGQTQIITYDSNVLKAHVINNNVLENIATTALNPTYDILDIFATSSNGDSSDRDYIIAITDEGADITIKSYILDGDLSNADFDYIETYATFDDTYIPITEVHCSEWLTTTENFECVYGATPNKIIYFNSTGGFYNITVEDQTFSYLSGNQFNNLKPNNHVIISHDSDDEISVIDAGNTGVPDSHIFSFSMSDCSASSCNINSSHYSSYTIADFTGGTSYRYVGLLPIPVESSISCDGDECYISEYHYAVTSVELDLPSTYVTLSILSGGVEIVSTTTVSYEPHAYNNFGIGTPAIDIDRDGDGNREYCVGVVGTFNYDETFSLICNEYNAGSASISGESVYNVTSYGGSNLNTVEHVILAGKYYDSNTDSYRFVLYNHSDGTGEFYYTIDDEGGDVQNYSNIAATNWGVYYNVDTNGDALPESLFNTENGLYAYYSEFTVPDVVYYDVNGLYGYYNPAKVNTNQTIRALECGASNTSCSYYNVNTNPLVREKLCTTCDGTQAIDCGSWSYTNPQVICNFAGTGTYDVDVIMYTSTNENEIVATFTIDDWVIDNNNNSVENLVAVDDPNLNASDSETATSEETSESGLSGIFAALENNKESIFSILLIIAIIATLAGQGIRNPIVLLFAAILMAILLVIIGTLDVMILVFIILAALILAILGVTIFKSNNGG